MEAEMSHAPSIGSPVRPSRRSVRVPCQVVRERDFRLVARHVVDLSTEGMLVLADRPVLTGEPLFLTLRVPMGSLVWLDAEAVVARVVHGRRPGDPRRALGLAFTWADPKGLAALRRQLAWFREASPRRRLALRPTPTFEPAPGS